MNTLDTLERIRTNTPTPDPTTNQITIWWQDLAGVDAFTSEQHPGETRTAEDLRNLPSGPGPIRTIIVAMVDVDP